MSGTFSRACSRRNLTVPFLGTKRYLTFSPSPFLPDTFSPLIETCLNSRGFRRVFSPERLERYRAENHCPTNDKLCATALNLGQEVLIGEKSDVSDVLEAAAKVQKYAATAA